MRLLEGDVLFLNPGRHIPGPSPPLGNNERVSRAKLFPAPIAVGNGQTSFEHKAVFVMRIGIGLEDAGATLPESDGELPVFGSIPDRARIRAIEGTIAWNDHFTRVFPRLRRRRSAIDFRIFLLSMRFFSLVDKDSGSIINVMTKVDYF